jgi:hypothetical protein
MAQNNSGPAKPNHNWQPDEWYKRQAHLLSHKWGERLDDFKLPCPLCRGNLQIEGARRNPLYEFAENEPGALQQLDLLTISFICDRCGYVAEFDAELFNPAYLAQLQGEKQDKVAELTLHNYRILVPLAVDDKTDTILHTASAIASVHHGDVTILSVTTDEADIEHIKDKIHQNTPL